MHTPALCICKWNISWLELLRKRSLVCNLIAGRNNYTWFTCKPNEEQWNEWNASHRSFVGASWTLLFSQFHSNWCHFCDWMLFLFRIDMTNGLYMFHDVYFFCCSARKRCDSYCVFLNFVSYSSFFSICIFFNYCCCYEATLINNKD